MRQHRAHHRVAAHDRAAAHLGGDPGARALPVGRGRGEHRRARARPGAALRLAAAAGRTAPARGGQRADQAGQHDHGHRDGRPDRTAPRRRHAAPARDPPEHATPQPQPQRVADDMRPGRRSRRPRSSRRLSSSRRPRSSRGLRPGWHSRRPRPGWHSRRPRSSRRLSSSRGLRPGWHGRRLRPG